MVLKKNENFPHGRWKKCIPAKEMACHSIKNPKWVV